MLTEIAGVAVGHWTDGAARTGCTVVVLPPGTVASGEVRGGAPATREWALLEPGRLVEHVDAVVLTGGSAFGLAAADGVMEALAEQGRGFPTGAGPVPIVVALGLFDLLVGDGSVRPGAAEGRSAALAATAGPVALGAVGAGTGATFGKVRGRELARPGGLGGAVGRHHGATVAALVAVNAYGEPRTERSGRADTTTGRPGDPRRATDDAFGNTTVGVVVTDAALDKLGCHQLAQGAHDGLARALDPVHTRVDGDAFVAAATHGVGAAATPELVDALRHVAAELVEAAVLDACSG